MNFVCSSKKSIKIQAKREKKTLIIQLDLTYASRIIIVWLTTTSCWTFSDFAVWINRKICCEISCITTTFKNVHEGTGFKFWMSEALNTLYFYWKILGEDFLNQNLFFGIPLLNFSSCFFRLLSIPKNKYFWLQLCF